MVRILTAIVFADIYGYTAMMQKDEPHALEIRNRFKSIIEDNIEAFEGTLIQFYGDGALLIFTSGLKAAEFAIKLQNEAANEPKVPVKTAIHIGDIVHDSDGVFGDGVNVTSRIESIAHPGSVLISDKLNDVISNQPHILTKSLGKFSFKNIAKDIEVFAIINEGLFNPDGASGDGKMSQNGNTKGKSNRIFYYIIGALALIAATYFIANYISKQNRDKRILTDTLKPLTKEETKELVSGYLAHLYQPAKPFNPTNVVLSESFSLKSSDDRLNPFSNDYKDTVKNKLRLLNFAEITTDDLTANNYICNFILTGASDSVSAKLTSQINDRTIKVQSIEYLNTISLRKEEPKKETTAPKLSEPKKTDILTQEEKFRIKQEVKQKLQKKQEKQRKRP